MPDRRRDDEDVDTDDDQDRGFSFSLPPIRLPPMFPDSFRVLWPGGGDGPTTHASRRTAAVALVAFDLVDAVLALGVEAPVVDAARVVAGALVAASAFGLPGLVYAAEGAAVLAGAGELTVAPTLTLLLVVRLLR
jgi:hypothetical protein